MSSSSSARRATSGGVTSPSGRSAASSSNTPNTRKIFVGGLHYGTDDASLRAYFSRYGTVESAQVMYNRDTAKSRGFGFVIFTDEVAVDRTLDNGQFQLLDDKEVEIKRAVPKNVMATSSGPSTGASSAPAPQLASAPAPRIIASGSGTGKESAALLPSPTRATASVAGASPAARTSASVASPSKSGTGAWAAPGAAKAAITGTSASSAHSTTLAASAAPASTSAASPPAGAPSSGAQPNKATSWVGAVIGRGPPPTANNPNSTSTAAAPNASTQSSGTRSGEQASESSKLDAPSADDSDGEVLIPASSETNTGVELGLGTIADDLLSVTSRLTAGHGARPHAVSDAGSIASSVHSASMHRMRGATSDSLQLSVMNAHASAHRQHSSPASLGGVHAAQPDGADAAASLAALALSSMDIGQPREATSTISLGLGGHATLFGPGSLGASGSINDPGTARADAASVGSMLSSTASAPAHRHSADVLDPLSSARMREHASLYGGGLLGLPDPVSAFARDRGVTWDGGMVDNSDRSSMASGSSFGASASHGGRPPAVVTQTSGLRGMPDLGSSLSQLAHQRPTINSHVPTPGASSQPLSPAATLPPGLLTPTRGTAGNNSAHASPGVLPGASGPRSPASVLTSASDGGDSLLGLALGFGPSGGSSSGGAFVPGAPSLWPSSGNANVSSLGAGAHAAVGSQPGFPPSRARPHGASMYSQFSADTLPSHVGSPMSAPGSVDVSALSTGSPASIAATGATAYNSGFPFGGLPPTAASMGMATESSIADHWGPLADATPGRRGPGTVPPGFAEMPAAARTPSGYAAAAARSTGHVPMKYGSDVHPQASSIPPQSPMRTGPGGWAGPPSSMGMQMSDPSSAVVAAALATALTGGATSGAFPGLSGMGVPGSLSGMPADPTLLALSMSYLHGVTQHQLQHAARQILMQVQQQQAPPAASGPPSYAQAAAAHLPPSGPGGTAMPGFSVGHAGMPAGSYPFPGAPPSAGGAPAGSAPHPGPY